MLVIAALMQASANFIAVLNMTIANVAVPNIAGALGAMVSPHLSEEVEQRLQEASQEVLNAAEAVVREAGARCQRTALVGNQPYALIIAAAESHGCDLIFMASHGRSGMSALLLGSETQKVLAHSKIPVLVYR